MNFKAWIPLVVLFSVSVSCDSGLKWNNPLDPDSEAYQVCQKSETGQSRCFNDHSFQICEDGIWQYPETCLDYEYCDKKTGICTPKDPCIENPCAKILHSTGVCETTDKGFTCECEENYSWKKSLCVKNTDEICNICGDKKYATGYCPTDENGNYFCECKSNYVWDSQNYECIGEIITTNCTGLPENAIWNTAESILQTWDGSKWEPSKAGVYNETESETECRFICSDSYHWEDSQCLSDTKNILCTGLVANATWNTAESITQEWNGSGWEPSSNVGVYNEDACTNECCFKCNTHYNWNGTICEAETRTVKCTGLPENAQWNSVSEITQIWYGSDWYPSNIGSYNEYENIYYCYFICNANYEWDGSQCVYIDDGL